MNTATAIVAIVIIVFFMNLPSQKAFTGNQQAVPTAATQTTEYSLADHSPAPYQNVSNERMDAVIKKYNKNIPQSDADRIKIAVNNYAKEKDVDPRLILAVMARESNFNPDAVSSSGAIGLGQIMPFNYQQLGITNPKDIDQNAKGVVYYIKEKLKDWEGSADQVGLALASYLKGTGEIKRAGGTYSGHAETYVNDILRIRSSI